MTIWLYEQLSIKLIGSSFENQPWLLIDELIGKLCYEYPEISSTQGIHSMTRLFLNPALFIDLLQYPFYELSIWLLCSYFQHFFPSTCSAQQPSIDWLFNLLNALQAFFLIPVFSCNWALKYCSCFTTTAGSFTLVSNSPVLVFLLEQVSQFCRLVHKHGLHL